MRDSFPNVRNFLAREDGASLVEYGLIIAMLSLVAIGTIFILGQLVNGAFGELQKAVSPSDKGGGGGGGGGPFRPI